MQYLFFILGLGVIALGIFAKIHSNRMYKLGITHAVVHDCQPTTRRIGEKEVPCTQLTLEIPSTYGVVHKTMLDNGRYKVGDTIDIFYDPDKDKVELPKNISEKGSKGPYAVMAFGAMICVLIVVLEMGKCSQSFNDGLMIFLSYFVAVALIFGGVYLCIIKPARRKRQMVSCRKVPGQLVDFIRKRRKNGGNIYTPIYEFYHNGEMMRIEGEISGNGSRYRQVGRKVTIVINDETGEKYCLEDISSIKTGAILAMILGIVVLGILIARDFFGLFGGSNNDDIGNGSNNSSNGSQIELNLNGDGYTNESVSLPEDERYCEYYYMPADKDGTYSYNIKLYHYGIGTVTIFPNESNGKGITQTFSFYLDDKDLELVVNDSKEYDFVDLAANVVDAEDADETMDYKYLYYYDGKERKGSGGYGAEGNLFDSVVEHIKDSVPQKVWNAIKKEIDRYYE